MMNKSSESEPARLQHSLLGLIRLDQMEEPELIVYVEGTKLDTYYYSKAISSAIADKVHIRPSREISGTGSGKTKCLAYFNDLVDKGKLITSIGGKKTIILFILDKDVDDLSNSLVDSIHILYTHFYCIENHLAIEGDIVNAVASAASLPLNEVLNKIPDSASWLRRCAENWRRWLAFCLFAQLTGNGAKSYGSMSPFNRPCDAADDTTVVDAELSAIAARCGTTVEDVRKDLIPFELLVEELLRDNKHDQVFKGKWYFHFAVDVVEALTGMRNLNANTFWANLACTVDETQEQLQKVARRLEQCLTM